jgi:hypothetical protein
MQYLDEHENEDISNNNQNGSIDSMPNMPDAGVVGLQATGGHRAGAIHC